MLLERKLEARLAELGLDAPDYSVPPGDFNAAMSDAHVLPGSRVGNIVYITAIPSINGRWFYQGTLGQDLTVEEGYKASQLAALSALLELKHVIHDLDRLDRIALMIGYITSAPGFTDQPRVLNGASDMFHELLGERGRHARAAIGCVGMVGGHAVEIFVTAVLKE
jgi:enamine deaminase RidA (YjgF/YER057c/UK114 family)